jgi:SWIM zinc finger
LDFTEDQILALAPDDSSRKSGKDLANPGKWVTTGADEISLWGECQGSGSKPYQTQIDLGKLAFKCSCPSRKFPCKHGLGLLLLRARQPKFFTVAAAPAWVTEWIARRSEKEEKKTEKKDKPVDEAAQAKRQQARQLKVTDGIEELLRWIKDIVRYGMLNLPEKAPAFWENMAKRMIDAQAPGLAAQVKSLGEVNFYTEGWQTRFLDRLLQIYLVIRGYQNIDSITAELQQDIRRLIGFTQNQEELRAEPGIGDRWYILAKQVSEEEQLIVEKNWLYGVQTRKYALILQFYVRSQPPAMSFTPGMTIDATLVFFPSALPLRATLKEQRSTQKPVAMPEGYPGWSAVINGAASGNTRYPFGEDWPCIVGGLKPVRIRNEWWLQDEDKNTMSIARNQGAIWNLLALSGGRPMQISLIGREKEYEPIGVWYNNEYKML